MSKEIYQDIWVNGKVIQKGVRECSPRYEAIKKVIERFRRPITVLDLGANFGYYSFRIASDFDACCVMIENPRAKKLAKLAELQDSTKLIVLDRRISIAEIGELSRCEYFDVVLALNFVHHLGPGSQKAIRRLGQVVVVETPSPEDEGACKRKHLGEIYNYWRFQSDTILGHFTRHTSDAKSTMFLAENQRGFLSTPHFHAPDITKKTFNGGMEIQATFQKRSAIHVWKTRKGKAGALISDWIPGINLRTYQKLGGIWPERKHLKALINRGQVSGLSGSPHGDLTIWNMILDGERLSVIDPKPWMKQRINSEALKRAAGEL